MHKIDLSKYEVRTDMIVDLLDEETSKLSNETLEDGVKISWMKLDEDNPFNKKPGNYLTILFNKSIQVTDNGISPGSGIGNKRKEISKETLNTKVISVGIPTVIDASTIVSDTINYMVKNYAYNKNHINDKSNKFIKGPVNYLNKETKITPADRKNFLGLVGALSDNEIKKLLYEVLTPIGYNLMVTPKEVDFILSKLSDVISYGINHSIHNI